MKTKSLVVAVALALIAIGAASASRDLTWIAQKANHRVHSNPAFRRAILLGAEGYPVPHHPAETARDIVKWKFTYNNFTSGSQYRSATVVAVRGVFGRVTGSPHAIIGPAYIQRLPTMRLSHAIELLRAAGFTKRFYGVSMGKVLRPGVHHTEYTFQFAGNKQASVDTKTGKVTAGY